MKKLIFTTHPEPENRYELYATVGEVDIHGNRELSFSTVWTNAKDPTAEQRKFQAFLPQEAFDSLKEMLTA